MAGARLGALVLALALALAASGCGVPLLPGSADYFTDVSLTNPNDFPVLYFSQGRAYPATMRRIEAHQTLLDQWLLPGPDRQSWQGSGRPVEATDERGNLVFCRSVVYERLEAAGWRLELTAGTLECSTPARAGD